MNGNLEPEERVYDCAVQAQGKWLGELAITLEALEWDTCLLYTSPSPRDGLLSRMPSSA